MKNNLEQMLINSLKELNQIEQNKSKIVTTIFLKTTKDIKKQKIKSLENSILSQAKFYNQDIDNYNEVYNDIVNKYTDQLSQIINIYSEFFINVQMELQEAECNQKIAITNLKKSIDAKKKLKKDTSLEEIESYNKKIEACIQKKLNYDIIIESCESELQKCSDNMVKQINTYFSNKSGQLILKDDIGVKKIINKLVNKFTGSSKFNTYVIAPTNLEVETLNSKLPQLSGDIRDKTISFVAKIRQAKDDTNKIFEKMIV